MISWGTALLPSWTAHVDGPGLSDDGLVEAAMGESPQVVAGLAVTPVQIRVVPPVGNGFDLKPSWARVPAMVILKGITPTLEEVLILLLIVMLRPALPAAASVASLVPHRHFCCDHKPGYLRRNINILL